ncbi:MAG: Cna B-type domain-containing protein, partial [Atopobiaceae bacterium]|nr:Cna B-type domain-containing protein [Atopobiaceae bacterium]
MKHIGRYRQVLCFAMVLLLCILVRPQAAYADQTNLRVQFFDADTGELIPARGGESSYAAAITKTNRTSTQEYGRTTEYSHGYYHTSESLVGYSHQAVGWAVPGDGDFVLLPHLLMNSNVVYDTCTYDIVVRAPIDYEAVFPGWFSIDEKPLNTYDTRVTVPNSRLTRTGTGEYLLKVNLKKKTSAHLNIQIPNLQELKQAGFAFELRYYAGFDKQATSADMQTCATNDSGNVLSVAASRVELGQYALVVTNPHGESYVAAEFWLEPLRIPRVDPSIKSALGFEQYGLFTQPYRNWDTVVGQEDADRMKTVLDAMHLSYSGNKMNIELIDVENKWTRVVPKDGTTNITEVYPEYKTHVFRGHTLKLDLDLHPVTIKKEWPEGAQRPNEVTVEYQSQGGMSGTVVLNESNGWSKAVALFGHDVTTFTEKESTDAYKPASWVLSGVLDGASAQTSVTLPTSQDAYTARIDTKEGTGVEGRAGLSADDMAAATKLIASNTSTLTLSNQTSKVFHVQKNWEIDNGQTDKPQSITVALQRRDDVAKKWVSVAQKRLSDANQWKESFVVGDSGTGSQTYRIRELSETAQTVWSQSDVDAPQTKSVLERLQEWDDMWRRDYSGSNIAALTALVNGRDNMYVPTVVYKVGDSETKYYASYSVDESGTTTTITDTAVLDVSVNKRWLKFGDARIPSSVYLMLLGRDASAEGAQGATYQPVYDALYGNVMANPFTINELKDTLIDASIDPNEVNARLRSGIALGEAAPNGDLSKSWRAQFGVRKYGPSGTEREYLGAELVTGFAKVVEGGITGSDQPVMVQNANPRYFSVFGHAYEVSSLCKGYERVANVINTRVPSDEDDPGRVIGGTKYWNDSGNVVKRPQTLTLHVYAEDTDGSKTEVTGSPVTVRASDGWVWSLALPKGDAAEGKQLVMEEEIPAGYNVGNRRMYDIENAYVGDNATDVIHKSGKIVWEDDDDAEKKRPAQVRVRIKADGEEFDSRIVTKDNGWNWTFPNLPKQRDGKDITYTVEEDPIPGYGTTVDDDGAMITITNRYEDRRITVTVNKVWKDNDDADGNRQSVIAWLLADGERIRHTRLSKSENWQGSFKDLPEYQNGKKIAYTVEEAEGLPLYSASVSGSVEKGFTITNTYQPTMLRIDVRKVWVDNDDQDHKRPESVTVELRAFGAKTGKTLTLSPSNDWKGTFEAPRHLRLRVADYSVTEDAVEGYKQRVTGDMESGFVITNTRNWDAEKVPVRGTKIWDDADNQDGLRPKSITVHLLADGEEKESKTVSAANGWTWDFGEQPKYKDDGRTQITYTVTEDVVPGYGRTDDAPAGNYDITNTHVPETVEVTGKKDWDDDDDAAHKRPEHLTVFLYGDGVELDDDEISAEDDWTWKFVDLPKYDQGKLINYTVSEEAVVDYMAEVEDYDITNTYVPDTTSVTVHKVWDDANNQDGKRPQDVTVRLIAQADDEEGEHEAANVQLSDANKWTHTFEKVDADKTYVLKEDAVEGYTTEVTGNQWEGFVVRNTYKPQTTSVKAIKKWDDDDDAAHKRPDSVVVKLLANGAEKRTKTLTADDEWQYAFNELPAYEKGNRIAYDVTEEAVSDYKPSYERTDDEGSGRTVTITNKYAPETTSVTVRKVWDDDNDALGTRPKNVQVELLADGEDTDKSVTLDAENEWAATFDDLEKQKDGKDVAYTVKEVSGLPDGYTSRVEGDATSGFAITNTFDAQTMSITVTKTWEDDDNKDGKRPESVTIHLKADDVEQGEPVNLSSDNEWSHTFDGLPQNKDGKEIDYTVTEDEVEGYKTEVSGSAAEGFTVTNSLDTEESEGYEVEKVWDIDALKQDRPDSITVALQQMEKPKNEGGGEEKKDPTWKTVATAELNTGNGWKATLNPPKQDGEGEGSEAGGNEGQDEGQNKEEEKPTYRVRELKGDAESDPVWAKTDADAKTTKTLAEVLRDPKTWENIDEGKLGEDAKGLLNNIKDAALSPSTWYDFWENGVDQKKLDKLLSVTSVEKYQPTVTFDGKDGKTKYYVTYKTSGKKTTITNTAVLDVSIWKRWLMFGDAKKPESVNLMLFGRSKVAEGQDGVPYLPVYDALYGDIKNAMDLADMIGLKDVLLMIPGVTEQKVNEYLKLGLAVAKVKADKDSPNSLLKGWNAHFGVRKYDKTGNEREYLGAEMVTGFMKLATDALLGVDFPVMIQPFSPRYFTLFGKAYKIPVICADWERTCNVINTWLSANFEVGRVVGGSKYWDDNNASDRPSEVTLHVYAKEEDGSKTEVTGSPVKVKASDGWVWSLAIPKGDKSEGKELSLEEEVPEGYSVTYDGCDVFNKKGGAEVITVKGKKTWDDSNDSAKKRPASIKIHLLADGTEVDSRTVTASNGWTWAFSNLAKQKDGKDIAYTITEDAVTDYTTKVNGHDVRNTYKPATIKVSVSKKWDDANDQDGKRPSSVTVRLRADGTDTGKTLKLSASNGWRGTFEGLVKQKDGKDIAYTVTENAVSGYTNSISGSAKDGFTVTNKHTPQTTKISGAKTWDDSNNAEGKRPQSITVRLRANGTEVDHRDVTEADGWKWDFGEKPRYQAGKEISYTLTEDAVEDYTTSVSGFDVTNTLEPQATSVSVTKKWDDADDADGVRPKSVTVRLLADGEQVGEPVALDEAGGWSHTFGDLAKQKDGKDVAYTVEETDVPEGYEASVGGDAAAGFTVTNAHKPETTSVGVRKEWRDEDDAEGKRPQSVTVRLLADGEQQGDPVALDEGNGWSHTFD